jgi:sugar transferase (PEP-CTERM system associated)
MAAKVNNLSDVGIELGVSPVSEGRRSLPTLLRQGMRRRILILGGGRLTKDLCEALNSKRHQFTEVVGILDCDSRQVGQCISGHKIIGTYDLVREIANQYNVGLIAICVEDRRATLPMELLLDLKITGREIVDGHQLYEAEASRLSIDHLKPSALIFTEGFRTRWLTMLNKRALDSCVSMAAMIVLLPLCFILAVLIKLDSAGPVFYRQTRIGFRGQPFMIWKFRSMQEDAEASGPCWASARDPRISRVGYWLRKWRLDEIPQLFNVLKGEMSLIGPRPERPMFVEELRTLIPYYDIRHTVRPGISGWAQTRFRYGCSREDAHIKLQYDLYYVKHCSLLLDFKIMISTIRVVLLGEGAR